MLVAEGGRNFSYDGSEHSELEWLDLNNILIPDLREAIQPANINQQFFRLWKRKLGSSTQSWGTVRALPKQKNLSLGRPLGDQSCNPLSLLCRILARFLDLCLAEFPDSSHFDRPTHASVIRSLLQIREQPFGDDFPLPKLCNYGVYIMSRDVDNGYMRIQHPEALQAWRFCNAISICVTGKRRGLVRTMVAQQRGHSKVANNGSNLRLKMLNQSWRLFSNTCNFNLEQPAGFKKKES